MTSTGADSTPLTALAAFSGPLPGAGGKPPGGSDFNAIPTLARARLATDRPEELGRAVDQWRQQLVQGHQTTDPDLTVTLEAGPRPRPSGARTPAGRCWTFVQALPQGVQAWRTDCPDTPARSGNPAVVREQDGQLEVLHFARCARRSGLASTEEQTAQAARANGFTRTLCSGYVPWEGTGDSDLVKRVQALSLQQNGTGLDTLALHVGLESSPDSGQGPGLVGWGWAATFWTPTRSPNGLNWTPSPAGPADLRTFWNK